MSKTSRSTFDNAAADRGRHSRAPGKCKSGFARKYPHLPPPDPLRYSLRVRKNITTRKTFNQNHFAQLRLLSTSKPRNFAQRTALEARPTRGALKAFLCGPS